MAHPGWGEQWAAVTLPEGPPARPDEDRVRRATRRRGTRRRVARWVAVATGAAAAVLLVALAWVGADALRARDELEAAASDVADLRAAAESGENSATAPTVRSLQRHASAARDLTGGPHWTLVGALPWVGPNTRAVQTVSTVVDDLSGQALPALVDATTAIAPATLAPADGRIDVGPLTDVAVSVTRADASVQVAAERLGDIDTGALVSFVGEPVAALRDQVTDVALTTATAARAVRLLPPMLGADGPRQLLLLVQNNAEQRATGGIPGTVLLLRVDDGRVEIVDERAGNALGMLADPVLELTADERALFGDNLGQTMLDVTFTPDFPRSAELASALWSHAVGPTQVDGVLSVDPGALAHVLGALGPLELADGSTLTAQDVEQRLLNQVYLDTDDPQAQDAFFAATAHAVLDALLRGGVDPGALVEALAAAAREGRLLVWSSHPDEQTHLAGTVLAGELQGRDGDSPVVGVYLEDAGGAKTGYYLEPRIDLRSVECRADGSQALRLGVTLTSTAPPDAAQLPGYLLGTPTGIVTPGEIWTNVLVYAPSGGWVGEHTSSDGADGLASYVHDGLAVAARTVLLAPGESVTLDLDVVSGPDLRGPPVLRATPTALGDAIVSPGVLCADPRLS